MPKTTQAAMDAASAFYVIWDNRSQSRIGSPYLSMRRARRRAERLNLEYGAHRYSVSRLTVPTR